MTRDSELARLHAQADTAFDQQDFARANLIYGHLAVLRPDTFYYFARAIEAANRLGDASVPRQVLDRPGFPGDDDQFFWGCEVLIQARSPQAAHSLIARETARAAVSPAYLAAGQARLLSATGLRARGLQVMAETIARDDAPPLAFRIAAILARELGDLDSAVAIAAKGARLHGHPHDARFVLEILLLLVEAETATAFAARFSAAYPHHAAAIADLAAAATDLEQRCRRSATLHGSAASPDRDRLQAALATQADADTILWGKRALIALARSNAMTIDDFHRFGIYLPNWENSDIKSYVLYHALRQHRQDPRVAERWLRRLLADRCYGDAAAWLSGRLATQPTDDMLAFGILLLRMREAGLLPDDAVAQEVQALAPRLRQALPGAGWAMQAVLQPHLAALGLPARRWSPPDEPPNDHPGFRRLFGVSTGRLNRAARPAAPAAAGARPVIVISGQVRGFAKAWPSLHHHVVAPIGAPVVMTVWDRTTNAVGRHAQRLERLLPADIVAQLRPEQRFTDAFAAAFPRTAALIFREWTETPDELAAVMAAQGVIPVALETEDDALLMRLLRPRIENGMIRMYYKLARAERLVREAEIRSGIAFSHVIWSRPDYEITRMTEGAVQRCLAHDDVAFSSWTTEAAVGDYFMVLPRLAFTAIASVFGSIVVGGDSTTLPWRPQRERPMPEDALLAALDGPETLFETLLAAGIVPLGRIDVVEGRLLGRTPPDAELRATFLAEAAGTDAP